MTREEDPYPWPFKMPGPPGKSTGVGKRTVSAKGAKEKRKKSISKAIEQEGELEVVPPVPAVPRKYAKGKGVSEPYNMGRDDS